MTDHTMKKNPASIPHSIWHADDIRRMEREAADSLGLTLYELMQRAGEAAFQVAREAYPHAQHWLVLCGHGNNGGDGYVLARVAQRSGRRVSVVHLREHVPRTPAAHPAAALGRQLADGFRWVWAFHPARWLLGHLIIMSLTVPVYQAMVPIFASDVSFRMLDFARQVREGIRLGCRGDRITDVINVGIGGSDLGPQMAVLALEQFRVPGKRFHFVSNIDGHELKRVLRAVRPESTVFLVASKTFTTPETMTNARSALDWFVAQGGQDVARHFVALTCNVEAARQWGITTTFGFWDWVGGRYSLWSAIGLPIAIAIGAQGFRDFLAGAHAMDEHFRTAPLTTNLPVRLALLDVWYRNFLGFSSRCIAPYHAGLRRLAAHWQQLEMESNGKRVDQTGRTLPFATSPVLWGEPGSNGQHAFFQMLHQGTDVLPLEIVAVRQSAHGLPGHHEMLLANALAQAQALMLGRASDCGHRHFPGNRPSTFLLLDALTPTSLGALIALQEHRVFVSGALWGINSFDQWGVELGKTLCNGLLPRFESGDFDGLDSSTSGLLQRLSDRA